MAKKVETEHLFDMELIDAIRYAWSKNLYYYPKIIDCKFPHKTTKVNIAIREDGVQRVGTGEYEQGDELYEKIRELYLEEYKNNK
jgi:hypothetical protein